MVIVVIVVVVVCFQFAVNSKKLTPITISNRIQIKFSIKHMAIDSRVDPLRHSQLKPLKQHFTHVSKLNFEILITYKQMVPVLHSPY